MDTTTKIDGRINRKRHLFSPLARRAAAFSRRFSFLMAVTFTLSSIASPHPQFTPSTSSLFTPRKSQAANLPDRFERANQVDIIERNHWAGGERDKSGNLLFSYSQWIMWRWDSTLSEHVVVWWAMTSNDNRHVIQTRLSDGTYRLRIGRRTFESRGFRETWTTYDPEVVNRDVLNKDHRPRMRGELKWPGEIGIDGMASLLSHEEIRRAFARDAIDDNYRKNGEFSWWYSIQEDLRKSRVQEAIRELTRRQKAERDAGQERGFDGPLIIEIPEGVLKPVRVER